MALIEFKDLPDTTTPLTASNLNNNFEETYNYIGELLWENSSPSSDFAGQTISLDLSDYDAVDIVSNNGTYRVAVNTNICMARFQDANGDWTGYWYLDMRTVNVTNQGVVFSDGRGQSFVNSDNYFIRNMYNKPLKIIGYKKIYRSQL